MMTACAVGARLAPAMKAQDSATSSPGDAAAPCQQQIASARGALRISPADPTIEVRLARALALCGQDREAIAEYRRAIAGRPNEVAPRVEFGTLLIRAHRSGEAIDVLREALRLDPEDDEARAALARAVASTGNNLEALRRYEEVLATSPDNYDALQGKAFVLYHIGRFAQARTIFELLERENPSDEENSEALARIARAEAEARAAALRPPSTAPPQERLAYYQDRATSDPRDQESLVELGRAQAELTDYPAAIKTYRQLLAIDPGDASAKFQLARTLAWSQEYDASIALYQELLRGTPRNADFLEGLALVLTWSGRLEEALRTYHRLVDSQSSAAVLLKIARLDIRLHYYHSASATVAKALQADPNSSEACLLRAQIDLKQGRTERARQQFAGILQKNPHDPEALLGEAEASYYLGRFGKAREAADALLRDQPKNVDALLLLARLNRARGNRKAATAEVIRLEQLSPGNPEARALETSLRDESASTLHTSSAYARENGSGESLTTSAFGIDFGFKVLRQTESTFSLDAFPSQSPSGVIEGAAAPSQFLYRQTTSLSPRFAVRAGIGLLRFGPGDGVNVPGQPNTITSAGIRPIGLAGASAVLTPQIGVDFNWTRDAAVYTPLSVRLGVIDERYEAGLTFRLCPRSELRLGYFRGNDSSEEYPHVTLVNPPTMTSVHADRLPYSGGAITFSQKFIISRHFSFEAGYSGLETQFINPGGHIYLGFFEPALYQRHLATARFFGKLWGPVGYDFAGGLGAQQVERGGAFHRAFKASPLFTVRTSPSLTLGLGYMYYNFAQTLGQIRGNALRFTTDWKF